MCVCVCVCNVCNMFVRVSSEREGIGVPGKANIKPSIIPVGTSGSINPAQLLSLDFCTGLE